MMREKKNGQWIHQRKSFQAYRLASCALQIYSQLICFANYTDQTNVSDSLTGLVFLFCYFYTR